MRRSPRPAHEVRHRAVRSMHCHDRADGLVLFCGRAQAHLEEAVAITELIALQAVPLPLRVMNEHVDVTVVVEVRSDHAASIVRVITS